MDGQSLRAERIASTSAAPATAPATAPDTAPATAPLTAPATAELTAPDTALVTALATSAAQASSPCRASSPQTRVRSALASLFFARAGYRVSISESEFNALCRRSEPPMRYSENAR